MKTNKNWTRFWNLRKQSTGGFTLVELIVVIAILAILAGVAVPAYSGYVQKANEAADHQLLAAINTAFASACAINGEDHYGRNDVAFTLTNGEFTYTAPFADSFNSFYEGGTFKVMTGLYYNGQLGTFAAFGADMQNLFNKFTDGSYATQIGAYKGSGFYEIGFDVLAGQIDNASGMMAELGANETSSFYKLLNGDANTDVFASYFKTDEEIASMVAAKVQMLEADPKYQGKTPEELEAIATNQLLANTAVLTAAKNTTAVNDTFISNLASGSAIDALRATTDSGEATADTVAQAAFAYAMYTSYKTNKGETVSGDVDLMDVYDTLESDDFKNNYMTSPQFTADKDGYLAAMKMVSDGASDSGSSLASDILLNGFNSSELVGLMQGVIK